MASEESVRVLIADKLSETAVLALSKLGAAVEVRSELSEEELPSAIGSSEVLIVRSTKVSAKAIEAGGNLSLIIRAGAGVNTIDLAAATRRGIHVANCPGKNSDAVAELAIGLMLAADRRIVDASTDLRDGRWRKKEYGKAAGLKGRTLGIVGLGSIGQAVAQIAHGLGMKVVGWSRSLTAERAEEMGIGYSVDLLELADKADAVSVHLALAPETKHLIAKPFFDAMKEGAIFVNTSRGEIVDTDALRSAIESRHLRAAGDVFESEPSGGEAAFGDNELATLLCASTPHIGASTEQASEAIAREVVRIVRVYLETGKPPHSVNVREKSAARTSLVVRHLNRVGVLASVLDELKAAGINIEEMENTIFGGIPGSGEGGASASDGVAASCTLRLDESPGPETVDRIRRMDNIIQVSLK
ncbi:MAG TPA: 3-phosphoglycerate dehydrogenase family protein [Spirochaetia bacterium]|nr:3-phosphoglycerate dehydrogenase family protein [Spirochaetia bacterium]